MVKANKFVLVKRFRGLPKVNDFKLEEEEMPELNDGEVLVQAVYLSIDPYVRAFGSFHPLGRTMIGEQIAKVIQSKNDDFPDGAYVYGSLGWRTHSIFNPKTPDEELLVKPHILQTYGDYPISLYLGHFGGTGISAYFGFLNMCKPKEGEVVVVTAAAGAVGMVVGQIAKSIGCKVIGITGSNEKCAWLTQELGFDHAINYKTKKIDDLLTEYSPEGVDCYFDNVGGGISSIVNNHMRDFGRIAVCGAISVYNLPIAEWPKLPPLQPTFALKQLKMQGFHVCTWEYKRFEAIARLREWTDDGKLKYRETITDGFENMPQALIDLFNGKNFGKSIVKV